MPRAVPATIFILVGMVALALAVWKVAFVLLLAFFGLLIAVFLRHVALAVSKRTPLSPGAAVGVVVLTILALMAVGTYFLGAELANQLQRLAAEVPRAADQFRERLSQNPLGQTLLAMLPKPDEGQQWNVFGAVTGTVSTVAGLLANLVVLLTVSVFLATDPQLYRRGVLHLIPLDMRPRAAEIMDEIGRTLWKWLIGQGFAMLVVGVATGVGLWLIGVPMALTLGLIAGVTDFVPFVGPWIGAAPGMLLALTAGPETAVYAALLYLAIQQFEGNVLSPLVQKRATSLPPVLTVLAVVVFGVLFGFMGVLVATPLLAVIMILVQRIYVEGVLGDRSVSPPKD